MLREYYVYMRESGRKVGECMAATANEACRIVAQRNGYRVQDLEAHA